MQRFLSEGSGYSSIQVLQCRVVCRIQRPADSPVVYIHQLPFFSCPRQHQPLPPCVRGHPSPHFPVPALLFFLLPQNIRKYFPLLLILPSPHHSPDEQNVTSGLHPSSVQFQPLCLIYSLPITPTGFQRRWIACPSLALNPILALVGHGYDPKLFQDPLSL